MSPAVAEPKKSRKTKDQSQENEAVESAEMSESTETQANESSDVANDATSESAESNGESPKPDKPAPLTRLQRLELHQQRILDANACVKEADFEWTAAKAAAKECKETYDDCVNHLRRVIEEDPDQYELPFPNDDTPAVSGESGEVPKEDETWRATTLEQLGISGKLAEHLTEAGLTTLGAVADYTSQDKRLTDIPGIGAANEDKIANAMADYWEKNPRNTSNATESDESSDASDDEDDEDSDDE